MTLEEIRRDIEKARSELLDLSLRNRLLHCPVPDPTRSRGPSGLQVIDERGDQIFDVLFARRLSMSFDPAPAEAISGRLPLAGQSFALDPDRHLDKRLQTPLTEDTLQRCLMRLYRDSRTLVEEQGINTLYLAIGFLHWKESPNLAASRRAPLILLPVELHRSDIRERVTLKYSEEDLGPNLSLEQKLKSDFGIELGSFPEDESLRPSNYCAQIEEAVRRQGDWSVHVDEIQLGFFSFSKLLMFRDLSSEQWPEGKTPAEHPILSGLITGSIARSSACEIAVDRLDETAETENLLTVLDADGSQVEALLRSRRSDVLVIQGPPGTGKSQTIANLVADAIFQEKTVLFVAAKLAALTAVKRRLDDADVGPACLELHSRAANKKVVLEDLRRTWELGRPELLAQQDQKRRELAEARRRLAEYANAVNEPVGNSGVSPRIAYRRCRSASESLGATPKIELPEAAEWDSAQFSKHGRIVEELDLARGESGPPITNPFWGTRKTVWLPTDREALELALTTAADALRTAREACAALCERLMLAEPPTLTECRLLVEGMQALRAAPDLSGCSLDAPEWADPANQADNIASTGKRLVELRAAYEDRLLPEAWGRDVVRLRGEILDLQGSWFRFLSGRWRATRRELTSLGSAPPRGATEMLDWCNAILEETRTRTALDGLRTEYENLFESAPDWSTVNWELRRQQSAWIQSARSEIAEGRLPPWVLTHSRAFHPDVKGMAGRASAEVSRLSQSLHEVCRMLDIDSSKLELESMRLDALSARLSAMLEHRAALTKLTLFNNRRDAVQQAGLTAFAALAENHPLDLKLVAALEYCRYNALIRKAWHERPILGAFSRPVQEARAETFRRLDRLKIAIDRQRVLLAHYSQMPKGSGGRLDVIRTEMAKSRRLMPVRKLIAEAGAAVQKIKPVFMMSPLSVAQFLAPGAVEFDLVVFDEASQVKVVDGFGSIIRGKQLIVVGDSKQLPPTDFFEGTQRESDEDHVASDIESLLKRVDSRVGESGRSMLRWHYRSRHESLIQFSNEWFYDGKLIIFPSATRDDGRLGLSLRYNPQTVYKRGSSNRINQMEAREVADAVMCFAAEESEKPESEQQTLMVATFSVAQRDTVETAVNLAREGNPSYEEYFAESRREPFEVKNLESVQGDERDVVFVSVGYGKDEDGRVKNNFGPLGQDGGDRRLNVLCSRARARCVVFCNFRSSDMPSSVNPGVRALQQFLQFAETGSMTARSSSQGDPESEFEHGVMDSLVKRGYNVESQVGCAGYRIDLAVVNPSEPGRYLIGIECDGAMYHSAKAARDRDRLRQEVLENRGWRIHRIWSTAWFADPDGEIARTVEAIESARKSSAAPKRPPGPTMPLRAPAEPIEPAEPLAVPYSTATVDFELNGYPLHELPVDYLARLLADVVRVEGPVHFEVASRRLASSVVQRRGRRIMEVLDRACDLADQCGMITRRGHFLSIPGGPPPVVRDRSALGSADRKLELVPPEEIDLAIEQVVKAAHGMRVEDIAPQVGGLFGLGRTSANAREVLEAQVEALRAGGRLVTMGDFLEWRDPVDSESSTPAG